MDPDIISLNERVDFSLIGSFVRVMDHASVALGVWSKHKFLIIILFALIQTEVRAVEVELTVR